MNYSGCAKNDSSILKIKKINLNYRSIRYNDIICIVPQYTYVRMFYVKTFYFSKKITSCLFKKKKLTYVHDTPSLFSSACFLPCSFRKKICVEKI